MTVLYLLLMLVAAILFGLAAFNVVVSRVNLVAAGLLAWAVVEVLRLVQRL